MEKKSLWMETLLEIEKCRKVLRRKEGTRNMKVVCS